MAVARHPPALRANIAVLVLACIVGSRAIGLPQQLKLCDDVLTSIGPFEAGELRSMMYKAGVEHFASGLPQKGRSAGAMPTKADQADDEVMVRAERLQLRPSELDCLRERREELPRLADFAEVEGQLQPVQVSFMLQVRHPSEGAVA